ncbi:MAG: hypothetical protein ACKOIB_00230, partial [Verrucomicrobiota bacterium]
NVPAPPMKLRGDGQAPVAAPAAPSGGKVAAPAPAPVVTVKPEVTGLAGSGAPRTDEAASRAIMRA